MNKLFSIVWLMSFILLTGCASKTERAGIDSSKVSIANTELGVAYLTNGKYKIAMDKLKKALRYDDENADAHHYIAELYRRLEENELADKHFRTAMELKEDDSSIKNNYGIFLCGTGSYKKGIEMFNTVLKDPLYPNKGGAYENMGLCADKQGNISHAEKYFESALKFNAKLPAALLGLAQIAFDNRKIKVSADYLNRHNKVARPSAQSLWLGILIARKRGYKNKVGTLAIKLKQYFPNSREVKLLEKLKIR